MNPFLFFLRSHLKLASLRQLSLSKSDRGFVLPLVIMIGLVLIVASLAIVASSHNSRKASSSQESSAKGLAIAETGVTRLLDLINQNRYISMFPDCISRNNSTGACNDSTTSPLPQSWATITSFPTITVCGTAGSPSEVQAVASTQNWVAVNGSDTQYRLINYQYSPTVGLAPGTASLTIEGRINGNTANNSTSRLEVQVPVEPGPLLTEGIPGVWLVNGSTGSNNKIQGDTLINDCTVTQAQLDEMNDKTIIGSDPITKQPYEAKYTAMTFPDLPTKPSPFLNTLDLPNKPSGVITLPCLTTPCDYSNTPTVADRPNASGVYEYSVNNIKLQTGSSKLIITPGQKVTIYLDGEIDGNTEMVHNCAGVTGCKPTNFQIYGYAQKSTSPAFTPQMCLIGNNELEAFIYAKEYTVGVGGTGVLRGTIWADAWSTKTGCGSNTGNIVVEQSARWTDLGLQPKNTPPLLRNISSWQRKQR